MLIGNGHAYSSSNPIQDYFISYSANIWVIIRADEDLILCYGIRCRRRKTLN